VHSVRRNERHDRDLQRGWIRETPAGNLLVDISGYFLDAPYIPTPHGIWTWAVPGVTDAFQNTQIEGASAFVGWPGLSVALLGDGHVVGWSVPTFGGYHLSPNRTVLSAGANVVQVAGSSTTYFLHSDGTVAVLGGRLIGRVRGRNPHKRAGVCRVDDKRSRRDGQ